MPQWIITTSGKITSDEVLAISILLAERPEITQVIRDSNAKIQDENIAKGDFWLLDIPDGKYGNQHDPERQIINSSVSKANGGTNSLIKLVLQAIGMDTYRATIQGVDIDICRIFPAIDSIEIAKRHGPQGLATSLGISAADLTKTRSLIESGLLGAMSKMNAISTVSKPICIELLREIGKSIMDTATSVISQINFMDKHCKLGTTPQGRVLIVYSGYKGEASTCRLVSAILNCFAVAVQKPSGEFIIWTCDQDRKNKKKSSIKAVDESDVYRVIANL